MRVKGGPKAKNRRKRVLRKTEGFRGRTRNTAIAAAEALDRAMAYNYRDRKAKKSTQRSLWILRLTAASRARGFSYSSLIRALKQKKIGLNRKMLADLASTDAASFDVVMRAAGLTS